MTEFHVALIDPELAPDPAAITPEQRFLQSIAGKGPDVSVAYNHAR